MALEINCIEFLQTTDKHEKSAVAEIDLERF